MGQSGFGIMDSDEAMDVHYIYFEKYNAGASPEEINQWFEKQHAFEFQNKTVEDCSHFWLGLAHAQWEVKALSPFVLERVQEIVNTDSEQEDWEEEYPERKKALEAFLQQISKAKKAAQKRVKQKLFKAPFEKGDVITYRIYNGKTDEYTQYWGVSVCLDHTKGLQGTATCLFARTLVEKESPATMEDLVQAHVDPFGFQGAALFTASICDMDDLDQVKDIVKIGKLDVQRSFILDRYAESGWLFCVEHDRKEQEAENPEKLHSIPLELLLRIPESPYSPWAEKIVFLSSLPYTEVAAHESVYKEVADFMLELKRENEQEYREGFVAFIQHYFFDTRANGLRRIGINAGYEGDMFE